VKLLVGLLKAITEVVAKIFHLVKAEMHSLGEDTLKPRGVIVGPCSLVLVLFNPQHP